MHGILEGLQAGSSEPEGSKAAAGSGVHKSE